MRHGVDGRQFGRNTTHRVAMLKNLANNLIKAEQMITTIEKAKEARRTCERLITLAKKGTLNSRRLAFDRTRDDEVVAKLFNDLVPRYKGRAGGYTRIVKISERRWGDAAKMCMIELVDHPKIDRKKKVKETTEGSETASDSSVAADPFSRFRKLFSSSKTKSAKDGAPKAEKPAKKAAAPKAEKAAKAEKAPAAKKTTKSAK
jgi:large subunit ribosomal protein L17